MSDEPGNPPPGEAALRNMKLLSSESRIFKVPKVPKAKKINSSQSKVLDEEDYVEGIAKIIERDFFPDLSRLTAQNEYLEASENNDYVRLREITIKYSGNRPPTHDPYSSPATFDTPGADRPYTPVPETVRGSDAGDETVRAQARPDLSLQPADIIKYHSLDSYLSKHTSEDNASYERVIGLEAKKRAARVADQAEAEEASTQRALAALQLPSIEQQADQTEKPLELDTWAFKAKNYIMYVPDGAASHAPGPKPDLQHHNTRLRSEPFNQARNKEEIEAIAKSQGISVSGKIGVDGHCIGGAKPSGPYTYVATPSPLPGAGPDQSPLMTWGEIEGTPFRLDGGDTPLPAVGAGAAYRMLESGAREKIGLRLAEQAARKRRPTTPRVHATTPSFRSNTERLASMSPAARKLAAKHLLTPRLKLTPAAMGILSHSATTPKPPTRPLVSTPTLAKKAHTSNTTSSISQSSQNNDLTDNLLQINVAKRTRLKAKDFFK